MPGPDEASVDTDVEMFPEIKEAKVFLDSLMHRVQANTSQEGSGVAAATTATGRTDRERKLGSLLCLLACLLARYFVPQDTSQGGGLATGSRGEAEAGWLPETRCIISYYPG